MEYDTIRRAAGSLYLSCMRIEERRDISNDKFRLMNLGINLHCLLNEIGYKVPKKDCAGNKLVANFEGLDVLLEVENTTDFDLEKVALDLMDVYNLRDFRMRATGLSKFFHEVSEVANEYHYHGRKGDITSMILNVLDNIHYRKRKVS